MSLYESLECQGASVRQQARASVRVAVEEKLDELPEAYDEDIYWTKVDAVYQHIYDSYFGQGRNIR